MINITLKGLEVFTAIVEYGSFSKAAEELYLSQSTISSHLLQLEKTLGQQLFDRTSRKQIKLTRAGEQLYPAAKSIVDQAAAVPEMFNKNTYDYPIVLGTSTVPGQYLLPKILSSFMAEHPDFRYILRRDDSAAIHKMMMDDKVGIGCVGTVLDPENLEYTPLAEDHLVMVTPNNERYQKLKKKGCWGKDLLMEPTIAREIGSGTDKTAHTYMRSIGYDPDHQHIIARMDDPEAIKHMVISGSGVSILSSMSVEKEEKEGLVLTFDMDRKGLLRMLYMIVRKDKLYSRQEMELINFLRAASISHR